MATSSSPLRPKPETARCREFSAVPFGVIARTAEPFRRVGVEYAQRSSSPSPIPASANADRLLSAVEGPLSVPPLGGLALFAAWNKSLFAEFFHRCSPLRACAMEPNVTPIERAFELARLGIFLQVTEIKERMREEGYFTESITGRTLLNQLQGVMQMARKSRWKRARTC